MRITPPEPHRSLEYHPNSLAHRVGPALALQPRNITANSLHPGKLKTFRTE